MIYSEIADKVIGAAVKVHRGFGMGFQESIDQRALEIEFGKCGLKFVRAHAMPIYYSGEKIGVRAVDFLCGGKEND